MPVFFLFNSVELLTREDCQFSNGNLAAFGTPLFSTAAELAELDFKRIYHVGQVPPHDRSIIHRRNAEVIVPKELDLSSLEYIFCRSPAEKETLIHLLPTFVSRRWNKKILVESKSDLFHRKWSFLETVELTSSQLTLHFSPDTWTSGPFDLEIRIIDLATKQVSSHKEVANVSGIRRFRFTREFKHYKVKVELDGDLAYQNEYRDDDSPF